MDWLEVTIETTKDGIEPVSDRLIAAGVAGFVVEDEEDFEQFLKDYGEYWDYVDEELRRSKAGKHLIKLYVTSNEAGMETLMLLKEAVQSLPAAVPEIDLGSLQFHLASMSEEDWANNWKQYYKPFEVGKRLLICPEWETPPEKTKRKTLVLNPGMSFGTGQHHTTSLCLELLEECSAKEMLDIGSGSGILSIAGLLLGAENATGIDIDSNAVQIAAENALLNGFTKASFVGIAGDILTDERLQEQIAQKKYGLITANIVADVIIPLLQILPRFLDHNGTVIVSGIIAPRAEEVLAAADRAGFILTQQKMREDWCAYVLHQKNCIDK